MAYRLIDTRTNEVEPITVTEIASPADLDALFYRAPRFELHVINDIAMRRWCGLTTVLGTYRSRAAASRALNERLRTHSLGHGSYQIREIA